MDGILLCQEIWKRETVIATARAQSGVREDVLGNPQVVIERGKWHGITIAFWLHAGGDLANLGVANARIEHNQEQVRHEISKNQKARIKQQRSC